MLFHYCPINSLPLRGRVGERGSNKSKYLIIYPLSLTLSRRERGRSVYIMVIENPGRDLFFTQHAFA
jgi:hypothetical protein